MTSRRPRLLREKVWEERKERSIEYLLVLMRVFLCLFAGARGDFATASARSDWMVPRRRAAFHPAIPPRGELVNQIKGPHTATYGQGEATRRSHIPAPPQTITNHKSSQNHTQTEKKNIPAPPQTTANPAWRCDAGLGGGVSNLLGLSPYLHTHSLSRSIWCKCIGYAYMYMHVCN